MYKAKPLLFILLLLYAFPIDGMAKYRITGKINLYGDWQPQVYLAAIDKLNDYYRASADLVINISPVLTDGTFILEGDNLPMERRFYRLYLMKEQNRDYDACLFVGGNDHNFVHIILNNETHLQILADTTAFSPFGNYKIQQDPPNQLMRELSEIVYPSFEFYKFRFPTELKLSEEKLHQDLKYFSDTCSNPLVSLAAVINTDFDEYFERDQYFYEDFGERLKKEMPHSIYTKNYYRKLNYYAFEDNTRLPNWIYGIIAFLSIALLTLSLFYWQLYKKLQIQQTNQQASPLSIKNQYQKLTLKEREILDLIGEKKSNKEIAALLFVEISTVKTHINKIYAKLEVKNRREAIAKLMQLVMTKE